MQLLYGATTMTVNFGIENKLWCWKQKLTLAKVSACSNCSRAAQRDLKVNFNPGLFCGEKNERETDSTYFQFGSFRWTFGGTVLMSVLCLRLNKDNQEEMPENCHWTGHQFFFYNGTMDQLHFLMPITLNKTFWMPVFLLFSTGFVFNAKFNFQCQNLQSLF